MANLFLAHHEIRWLNECPLDFKRYVDDTFVVFKSSDQVNKVFQYINQRHPNIKFAKEEEENNSFNFLDLKIEKYN